MNTELLAFWELDNLPLQILILDPIMIIFTWITIRKLLRIRKLKKMQAAYEAENPDSPRKIIFPELEAYLKGKELYNKNKKKYWALISLLMMFCIGMSVFVTYILDKKFAISSEKLTAHNAVWKGREIRWAIRDYKDATGRFPKDLNQLTQKLTRQQCAGENAYVLNGKQFPKFQALPENEINNLNTEGTFEQAGSVGWCYDNKTGRVMPGNFGSYEEFASFCKENDEEDYNVAQENWALDLKAVNLINKFHFGINDYRAIYKKNPASLQELCKPIDISNHPDKNILGYEARQFPKFKTLPANPHNGLNTVGNLSDAGKTGWVYDSKKGRVYPGHLKDITKWEKDNNFLYRD